MTLAWIDLETTGLDPERHTILEVAAIVTDDQLREVARFERVISWLHAEDMLPHPDFGDDEAKHQAKLRGVAPIVLEMHRANGLWAASRDSCNFLADVDRELADFLEDHAVQWVVDGVTSKADRAQLAGSTISFDRSFLAEHMPAAHEKLHYRNVDVTTLNELARRFWPKVYDARPSAQKGAHRAMGDIEESLQVARYYVQQLGPICVPGTDIPAAAAAEDTIVGAIATYLAESVGAHSDLVESVLQKRWKL